MVVVVIVACNCHMLYCLHCPGTQILHTGNTVCPFSCISHLDKYQGCSVVVCYNCGRVKSFVTMRVRVRCARTLMLTRQILLTLPAVRHTHVNTKTKCNQHVEFVNFKSGGTYSSWLNLKG
jgi:hypothetical protein